MSRIIVLVSVLIPFFCAAAAFGQANLDKAQLEELKALEDRVVYHAHKYGAAQLEAFQKRGGRRVDYKTSQGKQTAWLMPQTKGAIPERLWLFCAGNGSLALDLEHIARDAKFDTDAFLFVDYPGYGSCGGKPSPGSIRENVKESILAAAKLTNMDARALPDNVCVFGHSLGCAAALLAVEELHLRSAVLCAPFTNAADMAQILAARTGLVIPKTYTIQNSFDSRPGLRELTKGQGRAWIIHGDSDQSLPVEMSKTLAKEFKDSVTLHVIRGAGHNDIFTRGKEELFESMSAARHCRGDRPE